MEPCQERNRPAKPTERRYTGIERAQAVRLVRDVRKELGTEAPAEPGRDAVVSH
jgi:hypothetical protein